MSDEKQDQYEQMPPPNVVDDPVGQNGQQSTTINPQVSLNVDPVTAINMNALEFDKKIMEAEAVVSDLKKQRAVYVYEANVQNLMEQARQQQQNPPPKG